VDELVKGVNNYNCFNLLSSFGQTSMDVKEWQYAAFYFLASAFAAVVLWRYCRNDEAGKQKKFWPPCYVGAWGIPWIGCALEFGKAPLHFIEEARVKVVSESYNFTIVRIAGH